MKFASALCLSLATCFHLTSLASGDCPGSLDKPLKTSPIVAESGLEAKNFIRSFFGLPLGKEVNTLTLHVEGQIKQREESIGQSTPDLEVIGEVDSVISLVFMSGADQDILRIIPDFLHEEHPTGPAIKSSKSLPDSMYEPSTAAIKDIYVGPGGKISDVHTFVGFKDKIKGRKLLEDDNTQVLEIVTRYEVQGDNAKIRFLLRRVFVKEPSGRIARGYIEIETRRYSGESNFSVSTKRSLLDFKLPFVKNLKERLERTNVTLKNGKVIPATELEVFRSLDNPHGNHYFLRRRDSEKDEDQVGQFFLERVGAPSRNRFEAGGDAEALTIDLEENEGKGLEELLHLVAVTDIYHADLGSVHMADHILGSEKSYNIWMQYMEAGFARVEGLGAVMNRPSLMHPDFAALKYSYMR